MTELVVIRWEAHEYAIATMAGKCAHWSTEPFDANEAEEAWSEHVSVPERRVMGAHHFTLDRCRVVGKAAEAGVIAALANVECDGIPGTLRLVKAADDSGRASVLSASILLGIAGTGAAMIVPMVQHAVNMLGGAG